MPKPAYSGHWRRVRASILNRDGHRCRQCGRAGRLEVDHVRPLKDGGDRFDPRNLQALCRGCHIEKTRQERGGVRNPWDKMLEELT